MLARGANRELHRSETPPHGSTAAHSERRWPLDNWRAAASEDQGYDKKDQEDEQEDPCNVTKIASKVAEAKHSGYQRKNREDDSVPQHEHLSFSMTKI
jgi:hypothetical protein